MNWLSRYKKYIGIYMLIFSLTFFAGTLLGKYMNSATLEKTIQAGNVNILIMGIDARTIEGNSRSDTIILASINKTKKKAALVWIPRDTRVEVSANHYDKINSVNYTEGAEAACDIVGNLLGTKVDYYLVTNFSGFADIIDILGGVNIDVEMNMYHADPNPALNINLSKGLQKLNGQDALRYVRFRGGPTADIGRTGRQQKFIKALAEEIFKSGTILKLSRLIPKITENIHTNIPTKDMLRLAGLAKGFNAESVITQTLPGYSFTDPATGASYWEAHPDIADGIVRDLFEGKEFEVAQDPPDWRKYEPIVPVQAEVQEEADDSIDDHNEAGDENESTTGEVVEPLPETGEQQPEEEVEVIEEVEEGGFPEEPTEGEEEAKPLEEGF